MTANRTGMDQADLELLEASIGRAHAEGACHAGCGKSKSQCESDWKIFDDKIVVNHGTLPLPVAKVIEMSPDAEFTLVRAGLARGGGLKEHATSASSRRRWRRRSASSSLLTT